MKTNKILSAVLAASMLIASAGDFGVMTAHAENPIAVYNTEKTGLSAPTGLLTNGLESPDNVEELYFSWLVNDDRYNAVQTAYQILITDALTNETAWDSGKVESSEQAYIKYSGNPLNGGYPYTWKVRTWDKDGNVSDYSEEAEFSTGLADEEWSAEWIKAADIGKSKNAFRHMRKETPLENDKTVAKALAYVACCHDYELHINDTYFGHGQSFDYLDKTDYQGWDVTEAVKDSENLAIGITARWFSGGQGRFAGTPGLLAHIKVYYTDGSEQIIVTDDTWKTAVAPFGNQGTDVVRRNAEGDFIEIYDAQNEIDGWTNIGFDDSEWTTAEVIGTHPVANSFSSVEAELGHVTEYDKKPVCVTRLADGSFVADFGVVIPARFTVHFENGTAGAELKIQAGYELNSDGSVNTSSASRQSTDMSYTYIQKDGEQTYRAWDYLGFRYLQIPACGEELTIDDITAKIVHAEIPYGMDTTITTSDDMLNKVYELMKRSSIYSVQNAFVDTPTREKGQFLGDSVNISTATTMTWFERATTRKAILQFLDSSDRYWNENGETGRFNAVYPNNDGKRDIPEYTIRMPEWVLHYYMQTGDRDLLEQAYPYLKATADYISKYISDDTGLVTKLDGGYGYGIVDFPESGRFGFDYDTTLEGAKSTVNMISVKSFENIAELAGILGFADDAADFKDRAAVLKENINKRLINDKGLYVDGLDANGNPVSNSAQHSNSYALAYNIVPEANKETIAEYVAELGMKQGPMTADVLTEALFDSQKDGAALRLLTNTDDYGWARLIKNGYTFTWESWKSNSQSHGWGSASARLIIENIAGVKVVGAGASKVKISPAYGILDSMSASVATQRGKVDISYSGEKFDYTLKVKIPGNMTAVVELPVVGKGEFVDKNGAEILSTVSNGVQTVLIGSGSYEFVFDGVIPADEILSRYSFDDFTQNTWACELDKALVNANADAYTEVVAVGADGTACIGYEMAFSAAGDRGGSVTLPEEYVAEYMNVSFDYKATVGKNRNTGQLILASSDNKKLITLSVDSINGVSINDTAMGGANGEWVNVDASFDFNIGTAEVTLTFSDHSKCTEIISFTDKDAQNFAKLGVAYLRKSGGVEGANHYIDNFTVIKQDVSAYTLGFSAYADEAPLSDAIVDIYSGDLLLTTLLTDKNGYAEVKLKEGEYTYKIRKTEYVTVENTVNLTEDIVINVSAKPDSDVGNIAAVNVAGGQRIIHYKGDSVPYSFEVITEKGVNITGRDYVGYEWTTDNEYVTVDENNRVVISEDFDFDGGYMKDVTLSLTVFNIQDGYSDDITTVNIPLTVTKYNYSYYGDFSSNDLSQWNSTRPLISIKEDGFDGEYMSLDSGTFDCGAYMLFDTDENHISEYVYECDVRLKKGNYNFSQFCVIAEDYRFNNEAQAQGIKSGYILKLESGDSENWVINSDTDNKTVTIPQSDWVHIRISYIPETNTTWLNITNGDNSIFDAPIKPYTANPLPEGVYLRSGKSYSVIDVDNIILNADRGYIFDKYLPFKDEDNVGVTIMPGSEQLVYVALYDDDNRLLGVKTVEAPDKPRTVKFDKPQDENYHIRLFNWTEDMQSLANPKYLTSEDLEAKTQDCIENFYYDTYTAPSSLDGKFTYKYSMPYRYYLPQNYDSEKGYPVVMYLHGYGRGGTDNIRQLQHGAALMNVLLSEEYINNSLSQCIIVAPQSPANKWHSVNEIQIMYNYADYPLQHDLSMAHDVLIHVMNKYSTDSDRIYLAGMSMGGFGTWRMLVEYPNLFAAAIPLCGAGPKDEEQLMKIVDNNIGVWAFHGDEDTTVPVAGTAELVEALWGYGAENINYTELTGFGHDIIDEVFGSTGKELGLFEWLFTQSKNRSIQQ